MRVSHFDQAVTNIYERDSSIEKEAYHMLREALDYTSDKAKEEGSDTNHVSATELLTGFKQFALEQYGPMAATLLSEWNLTKCSDIGDMVFNLIEEGIFSKQESDKHSDFNEVYSFQEAFVDPFLPKTKMSSTT